MCVSFCLRGFFRPRSDLHCGDVFDVFLKKCDCIGLEKVAYALVRIYDYSSLKIWPVLLDVTKCRKLDFQRVQVIAILLYLLM